MRQFNERNNNKCPCKGCNKREIGCHGKCADFKMYQDEIQEIREKADKERVVKTYYLDRGRRVPKKYAHGNRFD